jgi:hypothetical protein
MQGKESSPAVLRTTANYVKASLHWDVGMSRKHAKFLPRWDRF